MKLNETRRGKVNVDKCNGSPVPLEVPIHFCFLFAFLFLSCGCFKHGCDDVRNQETAFIFHSVCLWLFVFMFTCLRLTCFPLDCNITFISSNSYSSGDPDLMSLLSPVQ